MAYDDEMHFPAEQQNSVFSLSNTWNVPIDTRCARKDILVLEILFQNITKDWAMTCIDGCLLQKPAV